jgi:hypothetical protein
MNNLINFNNLPYSDFDNDGEMALDLPDQGLTEVHTMPDLEINPRTGFSRNVELQELRNQHPFLPIDPPHTESYQVLLAATVPEVSIPVPPNAVMFRVTFGTNNAAGMCIMRFGGSLAADITSTQGVVVPNAITNPTPVWRSCRGVQMISFYNPAATGQTRVSVEFFSQL